MKLGDDQHPDALRFRDFGDMALTLLAGHMQCAVQKQPGSERQLGIWRSALHATKVDLRKYFDDYRREAKARATRARAAPDKTRAALDAITLDWKDTVAGLTELDCQLDDIGRLQQGAQEAQLQQFYVNFVQHRTQLYGEVPGSDLSRPNFLSARGLLTATAEPTLLRLEEAFERGHFHPVPESDYPMADISGLLGEHAVTAHAELQALPDRPTIEAIRQDGRVDDKTRVVLQLIAERLHSPSDGDGPRAQQAMQFFVDGWIHRRNADGWFLAHISQLAAHMGHSPRPTGDYGADIYNQIRESVNHLRRCNLRVHNMPPLKGKKTPTKVEEPAFTFAFFAAEEDIPHIKGRPAQYWTSLKFRPNNFVTYAATRAGAFLMGADPAINKLHVQHERRALHLGNYLQRQFRFNWDRQPGLLVRTVWELLIKGCNMSSADAERPSVKTLRMLVDAFDKLVEQGIVKHYEGDEAWIGAMDLIASADGSHRMTRERWARVHEARITIDAGQRYHEHYKNFGHARLDDPLVFELRNFFAGNASVPQKLVAQAMGITQSHLSKVLQGKRKLNDEQRGYLDTWLADTRTMPLPFDN